MRRKRQHCCVGGWAAPSRWKILKRRSSLPSLTLRVPLEPFFFCWMNSQPAGVFFSPHNIGSLFGAGPDKAQCVGFLSGTLRISLGPHRLMGVLNMMIMSRIGAERGWGEEKGVINQVATWGKKMLLLTFRGQSLV